MELDRDRQIIVWRILDTCLSRCMADAQASLMLRDDLEGILGQYDLRVRRESQQPRFILMRGPERYKAFDRPDEVNAYQDGQGDIIVRHRQRFEYPVSARPEDFAPSALTEECFLEVFVKDRSCVSCGATTYYSREYMSLPAWVYRQEFDAKHGHGTWERYERFGRPNP